MLFSIVIGQLVFLQLVRGHTFREKAGSQSLRRLWLPALRGRIYDRNGMLLAGNRPSFDIDVSVDELTARQRTNIVRHLALLLRKPESNLWFKLGPRKRLPYTPARIAHDISFSNVVRVAERLNELPGIEISVNPVRYYPGGSRACHLLGYVGNVPPEHPRLLSRDYSIHDRVGVTGIERVCEDLLHGRNGKKTVQVDHASHYVETLEQLPPVPGHDVILTIDATLQETLEQALGDRVGAAAAIDPRNGDILALVSSPGFDPGFFVGTVTRDEFAALRDDKRRPMFNRAISSRYALGSVFKLITAIAGLESGVITPETVFYDPGVFRLGRMRVRNFRGHKYGRMKLPYALRVSCNTFFCNYSCDIGVANIATYARLFGFGNKTGIELPAEAEGILPDPAWKRIHRRLPWYPGDTVNLSIGHGFLSVTPLQVACMTAAIANGGTWYPPRLIRSYSVGGDVLSTSRDRLPVPLPVKKETLDLVRKGMWEVVNTQNGSGRRSSLPNVVVAGKTGSAMLGPETYAWFAAFAPFEHPELAIAIVVEHAVTGGRDAAPVAREAFASYFDIDLSGLTNDVSETLSIVD